MRGFRIRMETLVLVVLIPSLLIVVCAAGLLIYNQVQKVILEGFDKKNFAISSTSASFVDGDVHQAILAQKPSEDSHMYLQYVGPMRRILNKADAKYVYSQTVGPTSDPTKDIVYTLDATVGPDHSHIGDLDSVPPQEEVGCHAVQSGRSKVYLTSMHLWQEWGLLKSCFTPIYDHAGHVVAMMGTDVNVTIVQKEMDAMKVVIGVVVLICILAGTMLAIQVARRLTRQIALVKDGALTVAAGQYGHRIEVHQPQELADLASSFNKLSSALGATVEEMSTANREVEQKRREKELRRLLAGSVTGASTSPNLSAGRMGDPEAVSSSSGYAFANDGKSAVLWIANAAANALDSARNRAEIGKTAVGLLRSTQDIAELSTALTQTFPSITGVVLLDADGGKVRSAIRSGVAAVLLDGGATAIDLASTPEIALKPGQSIVVGTPGIAALAQSLGNEKTAAQILSAIESAAPSSESEEIVSVMVAS